MNKDSNYIISFLMIIISMLTVGCDHFDHFGYPIPQDFPIWMGSVKDNFKSGNSLQIELDISEIWEIGDDDTAVSQAIYSSLQIFLGDKRVPEEDIIILGGAFAITEVYNEDGNFLGSFREEFFIYIDVSSNPDFEFVTVEFQSSLGTEFKHVWKYR